jgi:hypothetical protein
MAEKDQAVTGLGTDPTKINPYGASDEQLQRYRDSLDEGVKALQERYEKPNWFKVAAGFAKPQLGGFLASVGSAAEAMGENVEQERAQQLPIAQMKAQIAQADILAGQNKKVAAMVADRRAKGLPISPEFVSEIVNTAPDSATAKALQAELQTQQKQQEITSQVQGNALKAIEAARVAGVEIDPKLYTQAGLKPPGLVADTDTTDNTTGKIPRETLPGAVTNPAVEIPSANTVPGADTSVQKLPNGARVNDAQMQLSQLGIPIISGVRTQEEQDALKDHKDSNGNWLTKQGLPVANTASKHLTGQAIDVDSSKLTDEHRGMLKALGYKQPMPQQDPNHWELSTAPAGTAAPAKPAQKQMIASGEYNFNPLYTPAEASRLRASSDEELNKQASGRFGSLEAVANPKTYRENQNAIDSMIATITSNPKMANKVTNPLAQQGGLLGGLLNAADAGMGFSVSGIAGNIHVPVLQGIVGSYDKDQRNYYDALNTQAAKVAQIQQSMNNVNPSSIRSGEIELYKNASVNPNTQFPNVMLYNLQYSRLNNDMLHEMYDRANKIRTNQDPEYALHPKSRTQILDIMTSPAMADIADKYQSKFKKLDSEFLSSIQPKKKQ